MEKEKRILEILDLVKDKVLSTDEALPHILRLFSVVGRSEQLKAISDLKDFAYEVCPLHREDDLEEIVGRL